MSFEGCRVGFNSLEENNKKLGILYNLKGSSVLLWSFFTQRGFMYKKIRFISLLVVIFCSNSIVCGEIKKGPFFEYWSCMGRLYVLPKGEKVERKPVTKSVTFKEQKEVFRYERHRSASLPLVNDKKKDEYWEIDGEVYMYDATEHAEKMASRNEGERSQILYNIHNNLKIMVNNFREGHFSVSTEEDSELNYVLDDCESAHSLPTKKDLSSCVVYPLASACSDTDSFDTDCSDTETC